MNEMGVTSREDIHLWFSELLRTADTGFMLLACRSEVVGHPAVSALGNPEMLKQLVEDGWFNLANDGVRPANILRQLKSGPAVVDGVHNALLDIGRQMPTTARCALVISHQGFAEAVADRLGYPNADTLPSHELEGFQFAYHRDSGILEAVRPLIFTN